MKILKMTRGSWGQILAYFDLQTEEGFVIKGCKIIQSDIGSKQMFVALPSKKNDDKYEPLVYINSENKETKEKMSEMVIKYYQSPDDFLPESSGATEEEINDVPMINDAVNSDQDLPF